MEKEMNEKKKQKNITKKAKKIRSIVMMSLLCVLMLSAATYAWFTLSKTAKVANLTMTVGEATGLQIAPDVGDGNDDDTDGKTKNMAGTYGGVLKFGTDNDDATKFGSDGNTYYNIVGTLKPATTADCSMFYKPEYNDEGKVYKISNQDVTSLKNGSSSTDEGYYYETTFYLKALGQESMQIRLRKGASLPKNGDTYTGIEANPNSATGTYVLEKNGTTVESNYLGSQAVRISLTAGDNTVVYEPNSNMHGTSGHAAEVLTDAISITPIASTSKQLASGEWNGEQSETLTLAANTDTLVTMRIWIEGTDDDCVNEISLNDIIAQLQFEEVE